MNTPLQTVLQAVFGITPLTVEEVHGGLCADAYKVQSHSGTYFIKVYDKSLPSKRQWIERIDCYMPALLWLCGQEGFRGRIVQPVLAKDGAWKYEDEQYVYLLFVYLDGFVPGIGHVTRAQLLELAEIVAALHGHGASIPVSTEGMQEDISLTFCDLLAGFLQDTLPEQGPLADTFRGHKETMLDVIQRTKALRDTVRVGYAPLALCHTDLHGFNLMQTDERLVLLDWEGLRLAPPEADLFMFADSPWWGDFMEVYAKHRPGFTLDADMLAFYLLRRRVEDIWEFAAQVWYEKPDEAETQEVYGHLVREIRETEALLTRLQGA